MAKKAKAATAPVPVGNKKTFWQLLWKQRTLLLMSALPVIMVFIFKYVPIYGVLIAFKNFKASKGVWGSDWLDPFWKNFQVFFKNVNSGQIIWNTLKVGTLTLLLTFPAPIALRSC